MGPGSRRAVVLGVVLMLSVVFVPVASAREHDRGQGADCSQSSTGAIPIPDLGDATYQGVQGGLYPGGSNTVPPDHEALGLWHASEIEPLDAQGNPDPDGAIVVVSLGVSNTWREFQDFITIAEGKTAPAVELVNGAQAGKPISLWLDPQGSTWDSVDTALSEAGVSGDQVQAAWVKIPERIQTWDELEPFPIDAQTYQEDLVEVLRIAKNRYPNLHIAYLSSRIYGGYSTNPKPSPEPLAYENGFGVKWTIEQQINGASELNHDPQSGPVEAPWIAWGPYLWADGTTPRSDGLIWECSDVRRDGTHPAESGVRKVGVMLAEFFLSSPTAVPWFSPTGQPVDVGELPPFVGRQGITRTPSSESGTTTDERRSDARTKPTIPDVATTTLAGEALGGEAQDQPARGSENPRSPNSASWTLILLAVVLVVAVGVGVATLVISHRREGG